MSRLKSVIFVLILHSLVICDQDRKKDNPGPPGPPGPPKPLIPDTPNFLIFLADDLGYGDIAVNGFPTSTTPNIDYLATNGIKFNSFYSGASVCSPSRGALLTGKQFVSLGIYPFAFRPDSVMGLPTNITNIATALKPAGYACAVIGKWHLGVGKDNEFLPTNSGFDYYYGMPYSNSACPTKVCFYPDKDCDISGEPPYSPCPIFRNKEIVEQPADLLTLTENYVDEAIGFISNSKRSKNPFLMLMSFTHAHNPAFAGKRFTGSSIRGKYGDAVNEMDWAVGEIMDRLKKEGISENTFVIFTSDNGPSFMEPRTGGNAGPLRCGKYSNFEGGVRVPTIFYWDNIIKPRVEMEHFASFLDILPTLTTLAGVRTPETDGYSLLPLIFDNEPVRNSLAFYSSLDYTGNVTTIRYLNYKAHYQYQNSPMSCSLWAGINDTLCCNKTLTTLNPPLLYDLDTDPGEKLNLYPYLDKISEKGKDLMLMFDYLYKEANMIDRAPPQTMEKDYNSMPCCNKECPGTAEYPSCCTCEKV